MTDAADSFQAMDAEAGERPMTLGPNDDPVLPCGFKKKRRCRLRIVLRDADFHLYKHRKYELDVPGGPFSGDTGESGVIDHLIPADAQTGKLSFWLDEDTEPYIWDLELDLEPVSLTKGFQARLHNLQIDPGEVDGNLSLQTRSAAVEFESIFHSPSEDPKESDEPDPEPGDEVRRDLERVYRGDEAAPETGAFRPGPYRPRDAYSAG